MMPAKSQDTPPAKAIVTPGSSAGFGKVLSSIQGLQQRLDDFSLEEVSRAEAKAATLVQELSLMELKVAAIPLIKDALRDAQRAVGSLGGEDFEPTGLSSLEKYSSLSTLLATASKLQQAVRASPQKPPVSEPPSKKQELPTPEPTPIAETEPFDSADWVLGDEPAARHRPQEIESTRDFEIVAPGARQNSSSDFRFGAGTSAPLQANDLSKKRKLRESAPFDQRLLDDLIKTYGDFASFSGTGRAPEKAPEPAALEAPENKLPAALPDSQPERTSRALITLAPHASATPTPLRPATPPKTAFVDRGEKPKPATEAGTSLTRRSDIDHQLKRIVKDYGEYDLYSHHGSTRTKVAGIIAFVLLGLLMAAVYAFKAPLGMADHPAHSTVQLTTQPSAAGSPAATDRPENGTTNPKNEK